MNNRKNTWDFSFDHVMHNADQEQVIRRLACCGCQIAAAGCFGRCNARAVSNAAATTPASKIPLGATTKDSAMMGERATRQDF